MNRPGCSDHLSSCTQSEDDTVIIDPGRSISLVTPEEAERTVRDFVRQTTLYVVMSISLGTTKDSGNLREDMRQIRRQAYEYARQGKTNLVPWMIAAHSDIGVQKVLERMFFVFCSCLEYFCSNLVRTCELLTEFTVIAHDNVRPLQIASGIQDIRPCGANLRNLSFSGSGSGKDGRQSSVLNMRTNRKQSTNTPSTTFCEREDIECIQREIQSVRDIICEIHTSVAINAWAIGPDNETSLRISKNCELSLDSLNSEDEDDVSNKSFGVVVQDSGRPPNNGHHRPVAVRVSHRRRRFICICMVVLVSVLLFAIVLGVCITLLT